MYYLNYIADRSTPERICENTAYTNVMLVTVSLMLLIYGAISDNFGLKINFVAALGILLAAALLTVLILPRDPVPR